jgi:phosphomannomutase
VEEQQDPDPEFSTVDFPNPEEGASALDLSFKKADSLGAIYILANDPDADRLGVAQKDVSSNTWRILTGNEIGALLGWWLIHIFK